MMGDMQEAVRWEISVPIFKNTVILKQLGLAIGIPFGSVAIIIVLASGRSQDILYALGLMAALLILTWLFVMAAYRGKYEAEFVLDGKGVICRTQAEQARKNRVINTLTVILGLLTGKPAAAGAGMLAESRQETFLRWNRITEDRRHINRADKIFIWLSVFQRTGEGCRNGYRPTCSDCRWMHFSFFDGLQAAYYARIREHVIKHSCWLYTFS